MSGRWLGCVRTCARWASPEPTAWPLQNPVLYTLLWVVGIVAVFAPIAVKRYEKANTK